MGWWTPLIQAKVSERIAEREREERAEREREEREREERRYSSSSNPGSSDPADSGSFKQVLLGGFVILIAIILTLIVLWVIKKVAGWTRPQQSGSLPGMGGLAPPIPLPGMGGGLPFPPLPLPFMPFGNF